MLQQQLSLLEEDSCSLNAVVYKCTWQGCTYGCITEAELICHSKTHTNPLSCGTCDFISSTQDQLAAHVTLHTCELPHSCARCPFITSSRMLLTQHMQLIHDATYSHDCPLCGLHTNRGSDVMDLHNKVKHFPSEFPASGEPNISPATMVKTRVPVNGH
ncbi:hypothetical protein EB796_005743 [Bugula neritina]|uniref:C2H2-type domain-containing protein n=1 Tax=Bugula neritina TaxID=10212 RepID=A0A7J7KBD1_BUGNE|nr:hypothetical protein EB796_005743 [Bugula neritina]